MKKLVAVLALSLQAVSFAATPATTALTNLVPEGTYSGKNGSEKCNVTIIVNGDAAGITVINKDTVSRFALVNSSKAVSVDDETGAIAAKASLNSPFYINGGTLILSVKPTDNSVEFTISTIALDHRGNDASTYVTCSVLN